jgi:molybdopterin-containing oxidoreductase family iron-sulfur binding subunit
MELCPARARTWGDLDDPDSDVSKLIASRNYTHLLEEKGTKPSIYFLV